MPIQGVAFRLNAKPSLLELESPLALEPALGECDQPTAVVVCASQLGQFARHDGRFKQLGRKHPAKPLGRLLLGERALIPVIDTGYTSLGRLEQGAATLLDGAAKEDARGPWVLGVDADLFKQAWQSAQKGDAAPLPLRPHEAKLAELMEELPVPEEIGRRFVGDSEDHRLVRQMIVRAAQVDTPVLILGDTGTGKNIVARLIHEQGQQRRGPFKVVNCAAIPAQLIESELFGHMRGAFTDASADKRGQWEDAQNGTIFLDEIGELLPEHQAKLLQVLQEGFIRRVGGLKDIPVNARVIAATNRDLFRMVQNGRFREDLYYRLRQFIIHTPSLRDPKVLEQIAQNIWQQISECGQPLPQEIIAELIHHRWPGNVRELRSVLVSLENYFGPRAMRREHLRAVFNYCGMAVAQPNTPEEDGERAPLRVECIRQLRRAEELIRAAEELLKPLAAGQSLTSSKREALRRVCLDLRMNLRQRLLFRSMETFEVVERVQEMLQIFLSEGLSDHHNARSYWEDVLSPAIESAVSRLFEELRTLMDEELAD